MRENVDRIELKEKKGVWLRFIKLFPKCRLPWVWIAIYIVLDLGIVNVGLNETEYTAQLFAGDTSAALLAKLVGTLVINLLGSSLLVFTSHVTSARINRNMRGVVLEKVMHLPMSYFKNENPRDAIYRITRNAVVVDSTIMVFIIPIATALYTSIAVFGRIFQYDLRLSIILLALIPVQIFVAFIFGRMNFFLSDRDATVSSNLTQKLAELVTNIPLAKAFAKEEKETAEGEEMVNRLYRLNITSSWLSQFKDLSETAIHLIESVLVVLVGTMLLGNGEISKRTWITFFMFSSLFSGAIGELMMYWNNIKVIQGRAAKVAEIMDFPVENLSGESCQSLRGDIKLENVRFAYDEDKPVLTGVSCQFPDNTVTALLGVSGCGKTTLVNLLTRLYDPQDGTITVEGNEIHKYALADYRNQFVMVSQNGMLFSGTIRENVCYGNGTVSEEKLADALKKAGAYDFVQTLPEGLDTRLEEYASNLSGGQRQRLTMARALLSDAHYLILDEPAAAMDALAVSELMTILKDIAKDRCMIIIAHSKAVLSIADRVVVVENGVVTAEGAAAEVQKTNSFLQAFAESEVSE